MTCKDCTPVFYIPSELDTLIGRPVQGLVLKHVELCPLHAASADLREALKILVARCHGANFCEGKCEPVTSCMWCLARAAIAKAEA
jgi:hypothetical protein